MPRLTASARQYTLDLDRRFVRRLRPPPAGACVSQNDRGIGRIHSHQQTMPAGRSVVVEPCATAVGLEGRKVERDRRIDDVVVVDVGECRKVAQHRGPDRNIWHRVSIASRERK